MQIKDYKCKCGNNNFFFAKKSESQVGIYCKKCGRWLKWADKDEKNLMLLQEDKANGMTIDEVITRYKNNAEFERTHGNLQGCLEFRQLAKWLEELRAYRKMYHNEHEDDCLRAESEE
jgi:peptide subunit release factor 1 (eRF1)